MGCHHIYHEECPEGPVVLARLDERTPWQNDLENTILGGVYDIKGY